MSTTYPFTYSGAIQTWTAPSAGTVVATFVGAGGGDNGGAGGEIIGTFSVTSGTEYDIVVGGAGLYAGTAPFGGGGSGIGVTDGGSGGGCSYITPTGEGITAALLVAAGGGGGLSAYPYNGGGGGGTTGSKGQGTGGKGGTPTAGGAKASGSGSATAGSQGQGGNGFTSGEGGGGGGGGWYGGGGGGSSSGPGGGGGGSSYAAGAVSSVTNTGGAGGAGGAAGSNGTAGSVSLVFTPSAVSLTSSISDSISISDSLSRVVKHGNKPLADAITISDTYVVKNTLRKAVNNNALSSDVLITNAAIHKSLAETTLISETVTRVGAGLRTFSETYSIGDLLTIIYSNVVVFTESVVPLDTYMIKTVVMRSSVFQLLTPPVDVVTNFGMYSRAITDSAAITNLVVNQIIRLRTLVDSVTLIDIFSRGAKTGLRGLTANISISDSINRVAVFLRLISSGQTVLTFSGALPAGIANNNAIDFSNLATRAISNTRNNNDGVLAVDSVKRNLSLVKAANDVVNLVDAFAKGIALTRPLVDLLTLATTFTRISHVQKLLSDNLLIFNEASIGKSFFRDCSDSIAINTLTKLLKEFGRLITETVVITDNLSKISKFTRSPDNSTVIAETLKTIKSLVKVITEPIIIVDSLARKLVLSRVIFIPPQVTFSGVLPVQTYYLTPGLSIMALSPTLSLGDNVNRKVTQIRMTLNSIVISENMHRVSRQNRIIAEIINISSVAHYSNATHSRGTSDLYSISTTVDRIEANIRHAVEDVSLYNAAARHVDLVYVSLVDYVVLSNANVRYLGYPRLISDYWAINNSILRTAITHGASAGVLVTDHEISGGLVVTDQVIPVLVSSVSVNDSSVGFVEVLDRI